MASTPLPNYHGRQLVRRLKTLREQAGLTQQEAGDRLCMTLQKLSRFENGQLPGYHELRAALDLYGLPIGHWDEYLELWRLAKKPGWWRKYRLTDSRYVRMEDEATSAYEFQIGYLPELLQTEQYAKTTPVSKAQVAVRLRRQDRLGADPPLQLHAIVHEPVLSQGVDRAQRDHLIGQASLPNVTLQVLPLTSGLHQGLSGALTLLSFSDTTEPDIAFSESALGWSDTQDASQIAGARRTLDRLAALALSPADSLDLLRNQAGKAAGLAVP